MLETSGYRPEPQTLNISVCDEEGNCTRSTVSSAGADVQPPHRHTGVVAETAVLRQCETRKSLMFR
ncbi:hypothetical protein AB3H51_27005 [Escherichia coli]